VPTDPELAIEIAIEIATTVSDELVAAFDRLIPQLSSSSPPPGREGLQTIVDDRDSVLYVARIGGQVVGSLTLAMYRIPTGLKAWIEDVVVDEAARGRGIGEALSVAALEEARRRGAKDLNLTSRPSREVANRLYLRLGFQLRDTNVYRYDF
jgi:ribosomal protein S18 acetylase RimI-like enzyme